MISALEAARYPFLAPLSGYRNEIGIGDRFLFSGARGRVEPTNIPPDISRGSRAAQSAVPLLLAHRSDHVPSWRPNARISQPHTARTTRARPRVDAPLLSQSRTQALRWPH